MNREVRILCPAADRPREERIRAILAEFDRWMSAPSLPELVQAFGGTTERLETGDTVEKLRWFQSFAEVWNYRKKQAAATTEEGEAARWLLRQESELAGKEALVLRAAGELGLLGTERTVFDRADYILPLGGACMSNLYRCQAARETVDALHMPVQVVALSGMRPISHTERQGCVDTYAPNAVTEFDAISQGMCRAFGIAPWYQDQVERSENLNCSATVRQFSEKYRGSRLCAVAAPSSVPERRANSADCFHDFFHRFAVPKGAKLINCTSQIYCPYQQVRALSLAVKYGVEFDTIGFREKSVTVSPGLRQPVNYLQEIKGTVDAMNDFVTEFFETGTSDTEEKERGRSYVRPEFQPVL